MTVPILLVVTITNRSPLFSFTFSTSKSSASGTISDSGSLTGGVEGTWEVDADAAQVINRGARDWHADFYAEVKLKSWGLVQSFNMEAANPPDDPGSGKVWAARFKDGTKVLTANVLGSLVGVQLTFSDDVLAYHKKEALAFADMMSTAGVTVNLQFGEIGWWYFANASGMAYYDDDTTAAAQAALGRALHTFTSPTDDPAANQADADFLADRLKDHVAAVRTHVLASHAGATFELLWPADVNANVATLTGFSQVGGRLNYAVNMPTAWRQKSGSGFDRLKIEALAHSVTDHDLNKALIAIRIAFDDFSWAKADVEYLIGWFNGGAMWIDEYLIAAVREGLDVAWWAWDHLKLLRWGAMPLPVESARGYSRDLEGRAA